MSISAAMSNAMFGLRAAGRGAEVVSTNISNALTPGYGKRTLELNTAMGGGVRIGGITRNVDPGLVSDRRLADAANSFARQTLDFQTRLADLISTPDNPASISSRLAAFEAALVEASSRPDAPDRLQNVLNEAQDFATGLKNASDGVQAARSEADRTISLQVDTLNQSLQQIKELNARITATEARNEITAGLEDQRQRLVDEIGELVPLRVLQRPGGQIALYSTKGATLLDGGAATIEFTPANAVTPYMTLGGGHLSGITINGQPVSVDPEHGAFADGSIAANFAIRDQLGVAAQTQLDAYARDIVERFQDPAVDPSLAIGDAGLFTDAGVAFVATDTVGLSSRVTLNAAIDPAQGGEVWRLRDGINTAVEGPVGDATLLGAMQDALNANRTTASGAFAGMTHDASGLLSAMISGFAVERATGERALSLSSSRLDELTQRQLADGVDSDEELQRLIQVEQIYAANARMIEALDEMMDILNRL